MLLGQKNAPEGVSLTLSDCYGLGKTMLPKYPEPGKDFTYGGDFDFYSGQEIAQFLTK